MSQYSHLYQKSKYLLEVSRNIKHLPLSRRPYFAPAQIAALSVVYGHNNVLSVSGAGVKGKNCSCCAEIRKGATKIEIYCSTVLSLRNVCSHSIYKRQSWKSTVMRIMKERQIKLYPLFIENTPE